MKSRTLNLLFFLFIVLAGNISAQETIATGGHNIETDHGKKWKVNDEMMTHFVSIEKKLNADRPSTKEEYLSLAASIRADIDNVVENCTMKGKAHDELHKWLVPFIDKVNAFSKASDIKEFNAMHLELKSAFDEFHQYFN